MMKAKTFFLFFTLTLAGTFLFQSCNKNSSSNGSGCGPQTNTYYYISASDKALIPYKGTDTIKLQCNGGQIATFIGQGKDSGLVKTYAGSYDCPASLIENLQYYKTKYVSANYSLPLIIKQSFLYGAGGSYVIINFDNNEFSRGAFVFAGSHYDLDSLIIGTKTYTKIQFLPLTNNYQSTDKVYFNVQYGIIKIISQGKEWNLVP